jgi:spore coat protein U-like protein
MNTSRKLLFAISAIAATAAASSAFAQASASASANASVQVIAPITITPSGTLNFGRVVLDGSTTDAIITVAPGGTSAASISNATEVAGGTVSTPSFHVGGEVGQGYTIVLTPAFTGATLSALKTSLASNALTNTVAADASNDFTVGGTLTIPAKKAAGTYGGTVGVTVTYQ